MVIQFSGGKLEELAIDGPARQEIDIGPLELAGAGAAGGKAIFCAGLRDQRMNLVQ